MLGLQAQVDGFPAPGKRNGTVTFVIDTSASVVVSRNDLGLIVADHFVGDVYNLDLGISYTVASGGDPSL